MKSEYPSHALLCKVNEEYLVVIFTNKNNLEIHSLRFKEKISRSHVASKSITSAIQYENYLIIGDSSGLIYIWELKFGKLIKQKRIVESQISAIIKDPIKEEIMIVYNNFLFVSFSIEMFILEDDYVQFSSLKGRYVTQVEFRMNHLFILSNKDFVILNSSYDIIKSIIVKDVNKIIGFQIVNDNLYFSYPDNVIEVYSIVYNKVIKTIKINLSIKNHKHPINNFEYYESISNNYLILYSGFMVSLYDLEKQQVVKYITNLFKENENKSIQIISICEDIYINPIMLKPTNSENSKNKFVLDHKLMNIDDLTDLYFKSKEETKNEFLGDIYQTYLKELISSETKSSGSNGEANLYKKRFNELYEFAVKKVFDDLEK